MTEPAADPSRTDEPRLAEEMAAIPFEPLLPIEKRLIAWSLILGVVLLVLLVWLSSTLFPGSAAANAPKGEASSPASPPRNH
jgi:hypothetical protein